MVSRHCNTPIEQLERNGAFLTSGNDAHIELVVAMRARRVPILDLQVRNLRDSTKCDASLPLAKEPENSCPDPDCVRGPGSIKNSNGVALKYFLNRTECDDISQPLSKAD